MPFLFPDVKKAMMRYRNPDRFYKERSRVLSLDVSGSPGVKTLQFQAVVQAKTKGEPNYTTTIRFFDVPLSKEQRNTNHDDLQIGAVTYYHPTPSVKRNPCQIKCTCKDFRFSFEKQNFDAGGLIGNWRRYQRKTPPATRPKNARNPNKDGRDFVNAEPDGGDTATGWCKHIQTLLTLLHKEGKVRN
jgi:hypothetical protein